MITFALILWTCAAAGCHQEPIRPVYRHLTQSACEETRMAQDISAGALKDGVWTQAMCRRERKP